MAKRTRKFKTEVQQLLDLVIHSLYSKKEIFLRELVSNASDAIDRAPFEALTDKSILDEGEDWKIEIIPDEAAGTLTIRDNGIGMSPEEVETHIGTIANSGTRNYLEALQEAKTPEGVPELIGQFGVGFYSAFMVADRVEVLTRRAGQAQATRWTSKGAGSYSLEEAEKEARGTDVILHLAEGQEDNLKEWTIRRIVKAYSDYIVYPVVMDVRRTKPAEEEGGEAEETIEEETLNSRKAVWKKAKRDVTEEEYNEFYKHVSHDYTDPLRVIHYAAEGATEFHALLYIPASAPFDLFMREGQKGVHLYVKNVHITDDCKALLPEYLRFMKGVVDSSDLPLNVSREMLQDDVIIKRISKSLVGRILKELADLREKEAETYLAFFNEFGPVVKEGMYFDAENGEKIRELLMFPSTFTEAGKRTTLKEYVERMPSEQKEIYYIAGDSVDAVARSPHLEVLKQRGFEVLYFTDTIDEWMLQRLTEYDGKVLKAADRADLDLAGGEEEAKTREDQEAAAASYKDLLAFMGTALEEDVQEVRVSARLTDSACCLVVDEGALNPHMERIMKAMHQEVPATKRILEVNPSHPVLEKMQTLFEANAEDPTLADYVVLLFNQALLAEGSAPKDPVKFTQLVSDLMVTAG